MRELHLIFKNICNYIMDDIFSGISFWFGKKSTKNLGGGFNWSGILS